MKATTREHLAAMDTMLVQSAWKFTSEGEMVTLHGLAVTLCVTLRPEQDVGHLQTRDVIDLWDQGGETSFAAKPPVAVLSFFDTLLKHDHGPPADVVVVLGDPHLRGPALTYPVVILDGRLPAETGGCSLFIDATGRPAIVAAAAGRSHVAVPS
jgi:hypothetical protein